MMSSQPIINMMSSQPNTFYNLDEIKEYINDKLEGLWKEELEEYDDLEEFFRCNCNNGDLYSYDITNINCVFECIQYVNEKHNDMCGEDIHINKIDTQDKLTLQLIYFIGDEWKCKKEEEEEEEEKCSLCKNTFKRNDINKTDMCEKCIFRVVFLNDIVGFNLDK